MTKYLLNKYYPEIKCQLYALTKGRYGHCVCGFEDDGLFYHLENAWDKELGLHGAFESEKELKNYFEGLYHKHHDKDTDAPVFVRTYEEYLAERENLNEDENNFTNELLESKRSLYSKLASMTKEEIQEEIDRQLEVCFDYDVDEGYEEETITVYKKKD